MGKVFVGTIAKNDLAGGFWELQCTDGTNYQLNSSDKSLLVAGKKVKITGAVDTNAMGIGMSGPHLNVDSWEAA